MTNEIWNSYYHLIKAVEDTIITNSGIIAGVSTRLLNAFNDGNKLLICGNGGSAADAEHLAAEFVGRFNGKYLGLPAIALTNPAILTAIANDSGDSYIFERQVQALGKKGDCLLVISTSGSSENIILALKEARRLGVTTISLTRKIPAPNLEIYSDYVIRCQSENTQRLQETFLFVEHLIAQLVSEQVKSDTFFR